MASRITIAWRHVGSPCILMESFTTLFGSRIDLMNANDLSETRQQETSLKPMLYIANEKTETLEEARPFDNTDKFGFLANGQCKNKLLMVHPRSRHALIRNQGMKHLPYHLHIFCDDAILFRNTREGSRSSKNMLKCDVMYSENVAKKLTAWLTETEPHRGIRSGTHVNMTRGLRGALVAGVMTGGAKEPLGSIS